MKTPRQSAALAEIEQATACYMPADRTRMRRLLLVEGPLLAQALKEAHSVLLWESETSAGEAKLHDEFGLGSLDVLRAQAAAIDRCATLQRLQAQLMYEVATIVERNGHSSQSDGEKAAE